MVNPHRRTHHSSGMQSLLWHCLCHLRDFLICNLFLTKNAPLFSSSAHRADTKPWSRSYEGVATLKKSQKRICFICSFFFVWSPKADWSLPGLCPFFDWVVGRDGGQMLGSEMPQRQNPNNAHAGLRASMTWNSLHSFVFSKKWIKRIMKNNLRVNVCFCFLWILKGKKPWACKIRVTYVSNQLSEKWTLTLLSIISFTAIGLRTARYVLHL